MMKNHTVTVTNNVQGTAEVFQTEKVKISRHQKPKLGEPEGTPFSQEVEISFEHEVTPLKLAELEAAIETPPPTGAGSDVKE